MPPGGDVCLDTDSMTNRLELHLLLSRGTQGQVGGLRNMMTTRDTCSAQHPDTYDMVAGNVVLNGEWSTGSANHQSCWQAGYTGICTLLKQFDHYQGVSKGIEFNDIM